MTKAFVIDATERVVWTAVQAFAATLLASGFFDGIGLSFTDALKVSALAAGASALKSFIALGVGSDNTAQLGADTYTNDEPVSLSRNVGG